MFKKKSQVKPVHEPTNPKLLLDYFIFSYAFLKNEKFFSYTNLQFFNFVFFFIEQKCFFFPNLEI